MAHNDDYDDKNILEEAWDTTKAAGRNAASTAEDTWRDMETSFKNATD